jgi:hypothetical protein
MKTRWLIGIDDTDNLESRGTGHLARQLGFALTDSGVAELKGITRHQLLVHKDIPYTSHNSSACLEVYSHEDSFNEIRNLCAEFLVNNAAEGSDAGLCIAKWSQITHEIENWGDTAKKRVLQFNDAPVLAKQHGIYLEGFTGTRGGIIGSLAAVGLRYTGNDGRFLWLKNLRETKGVFQSKELLSLIEMDTICDILGNTVHPEAQIHTGEWLRPVMKNKKIVVFVEKSINPNEYEWQFVSKDYIKSISC